MLPECQQMVQDSIHPAQQNHGEHILEYDPNSHHRPAELATNPNTSSKVGLHDQEDHCAPENCLQSIQNPVGFVALPAAESLDVLGGNLVSDEYQGFGTLGVC